MNKSLSTIVIIVTALIIMLTSCKKGNFGPEDFSHFIPKDTATAWVNRFDAKYTSLEGRKDSNNLRLLAFANDFKKGKWMMGTMMQQEKVVGFRVYYGINSKDSIVPILVGLDAQGNDVYWKRKKSKSIPVTAGPDTDWEEGAMDMSQKAPPPPMGAERMLISPQILRSR